MKTYTILFVGDHPHRLDEITKYHQSLGREDLIFEQALITEVSDGILKSANLIVTLNKYTAKLLGTHFTFDTRKLAALGEDFLFPEWVDIFDHDGHFLKFALPLPISNLRKYYHRGAHVVLVSMDNKIYIQKRSKNQFFLPRTLDVTLGGSSNAGEVPESTAIRETFEETGITVFKKDLEFLGVYHEHAYYPSRKTYNYSFSHVYVVHLREKNPKITIQESEVESMEKISLRNLKKLIDNGHLRGYGRLIQRHNFYQDIYDYLKKK